MKLTEQQAINYITGIAMSLRAKIDIVDSMQSDSTNYDPDTEELFITKDERMLCSSLEIVLQKARVNVFFEGSRNKDQKSDKQS